MIDYNRLALEIAKQSPCKKRKVGAVIVKNGCYAAGYNYNPDGSCELPSGETDPNIVHAEMAAIAALLEKHSELTPVHGTMYVTHPPCGSCQAELERLHITVKIVEEFMKFDSSKLRYELIPCTALEGLASVFTYGARKYKPHNYLKGEPDRFLGALYRHLIAWQQGEEYDPESGLPHLWHLATNVAILIELERIGKTISR